MTNDNNHKLRAVILAALMVFSVIAMSGAASASITRPVDAGNTVAIEYDVNDGGDGGGEVTNGSILFQGEDIDDVGIDSGIVDEAGNPITAANLQRQAEAGGETLSLPISQDQTLGSYSNTSGPGGFTVTVDSPRITTFDVNNNNTDVNGGILTTDQSGANVRIDFNFERSEQIELDIEDENGVDVTELFLNNDNSSVINATNESVSGNNQVLDAGEVLIDIDPGQSGIDEGEYTFTASGTDDLDFGEASQSTTVTVVSDQTANLEVNQDPAIQGDNNDFTITDSPEGSFHAVVIDQSEFRDGVGADNAEQIFRPVGDTVQSGLLDTAGDTVQNRSDNVKPLSGGNFTDAFAIVEIDGGSGVGSIETQFLDDASATVEVFPASGTAEDDYLNQNDRLTNDSVGDLFNNNDDDSIDFDIEEGSVSITNPTDTYVVGSEVDLQGEANTGIDEVAVYARDQGNFERVPIDGENATQVEGDNTFSEEGVVLTNNSGNLGAGILSIPGTYRLGVIDVQDADLDDNGDGEPDATLTPQEFNGGVSNAESITVTDTRLTGNFTTYNGQISTLDSDIDTQGLAIGKSSQGVAVVFVGPRGGVGAHEVSVDSDGSFDEEDLRLAGGGDDASALAEGTVTAHIISSGRDGEFGDGTTDGDADAVNQLLTNASDLGSSGEGIRGLAGTAGQVNERIVAATVDDTASDDLIVTETFRLSNPLTTIQSVSSPVETNGTIEIEGQTNAQPDDNTIVIELLTEEDDVIQTTSTDQWGTDGVYSAELNLEDVEPGNYTIEVDDSDSSDRASVEVVEQVQETPEPTPEPTPTEEPTPTATPEPTPTATPEPTPTATPTPTPTSTPTGTPGFGIVVALIALVAAALLAVRRNN